MPKTLPTALAAWLLVVVAFATVAARPAWAQTGKMPPPTLKVGDVAPDFKLKYLDSTGLKDVSLSQYRGKSNVVLAFYIFAFTGG
jgi:AhpC/TSA family protein